MNSKAERFGIRANVEYKVNSWLRVGARLNYTRRNSQEPFDLFRVFEQQQVRLLSSLHIPGMAVSVR